jgi:GNAT superfamily N-acetyltransferase
LVPPPGDEIPKILIQALSLRGPETGYYGDKGDRVANYDIQTLTSDRIVETSAILARAFVDNPLHLRVFGGADGRELLQSKNMFQAILTHLPGSTEVVTRDGAVVGAARWVCFPLCRPTFSQRFRLAPSTLFRMGPAGYRLRRWLATWGNSEPNLPHWHLGPVGVDPSEQGQGIGKVMMESFLGELDEAGMPAYLETDLLVNVGFYERFGFQVLQELPVLERPTWLMWRPLRG